MIAVAEGVHIEAVAGAYVGERRHAYGFGADEIVIGGEFHVGGLAGENRDAMPGPFGKRGIVGKVVAAGRRRTLVRFDDQVKSEGLWCLYQAQPAAIECLDYGLPLIDLLDGIGDGNGGHRRAVLCRGVDRAGDKRARQERSRRIVDQHKVGPDGAERLEPSANRGLPCGAAPDRGQALEASGRGAERFRILCVNNGLHGVDLRMGKKGR